MAAPAMTERMRAAAGAIPTNLKEAAPDDMLEGVDEDAEDVPVELDLPDETAAVPVTEGTDAVPVDLQWRSTQRLTSCKQSLTKGLMQLSRPRMPKRPPKCWQHQSRSRCWWRRPG